MDISAPVNLTLEDVQSHFEQWRSTRDKRSKIPESLWQEVISIAKRYRHTKIIQSLRLNSSQLKSKIQASSKFIKLEPSSQPISAVAFETLNCVIYHRNGSHLNISLQHSAFLKEVITSFLQA